MLNVLSLFDGISCGQVALQKAGIKINKYYASEIDPYALKVTTHKYPKTIQLGDVRNINIDKLDKINLIIGGSPCQGFSIAGAGLNFEDPRSKLFFEFERILKDVKKINPNVSFLLENVPMKEEWSDIITKRLGVNPIIINSSLVSAQNRKRLYWTNIPNITQPKDKGIMLRDIMEDIKDMPIKLNKNQEEKIKKLNVRINKMGTLTEATVGRGGSSHEYLSMLKRVKGVIVVRNIYPSGGQNGNIYSIEGKSKTLSAGVGITGNGIGSSNSPKVEVDNKEGWRKLTPVECERLQTLPDNYTESISNTRRYKHIGNGWTVDVISHILSHIPLEENSKEDGIPPTNKLVGILPKEL
jgi:DNA (cytosine-5)-methyltransferase 3A